MVQSFQESVAVVTGGAEGLGRRYVLLLLSLGAKVSFCDLNSTKANLLIDSLSSEQQSSVLFTECNVTNNDQLLQFVTRTVQKFGGIDLLIPNAGITGGGQYHLPESSRPQFADTLAVQVNLLAVIQTVYLCLPHLNQGSTIVFISSLYGLYPLAADPLYAASKHGIIGFARSMDELARSRYGVARVLMIGPGYILTPLIQDKVPRELLDQTVGILTEDQYLLEFERFLNEGESGEFWEVLPTETHAVTFRELPKGLPELHEAMLQPLAAAPFKDP